MSEPAAPADPQKFTTIAHAGHRFYSPLSAARAAALVELLPLTARDCVLDIGCGRAQFLMDLLQRWPAHGIGVDTNASFVARARLQAQAMGLAGRLELVARPLVEAVRPEATFGVVLCLGSSQAVGTIAEALAWIHAALRPGGLALVADGYWKQPPPQPYLDVLGATADELETHAGNAALVRSAGFRVLHTMTANDDEWDEYEGLYCGAVERYVDAHPDDPDARAMGERIRRWHDAYLAWGRVTLGFGFYLLQKPSRD